MLYLLLFAGLTFVIPAWSQNPSTSALTPSKPQQQQSSPAQQPTDGEKRGTQESPVFVKQLPPDKTQAEADQGAKDRTDKATNDGRLVRFTLLLVIATFILGAVGSLQLFVFGYQAIQLKRTVKAASDQSVEMKNSITQAARAADAMEAVATQIEQQVSQMIEAGKKTDELIKQAGIQAAAARESTDALVNSERAWVDGDLIAQTNVRFRLDITNHGKTPAYIRSYKLDVGWFTPANEFEVAQALTNNLDILYGSGELHTAGGLNLDNYFAKKEFAGKMAAAIRIVIDYEDTVTFGSASHHSRKTTFVCLYNRVDGSMIRQREHTKYE
jgi:hypothetical protein